MIRSSELIFVVLNFVAPAFAVSSPITEVSTTLRFASVRRYLVSIKRQLEKKEKHANARMATVLTICYGESYWPRFSSLTSNSITTRWTAGDRGSC